MFSQYSLRWISPKTHNWILFVQTPRDSPRLRQTSDLVHFSNDVKQGAGYSEVDRGVTWPWVLSVMGFQTPGKERSSQ
jgi:hypothetical protein